MGRSLDRQTTGLDAMGLIVCTEFPTLSHQYSVGQRVDRNIFAPQRAITVFPLFGVLGVSIGVPRDTIIPHWQGKANQIHICFGTQYIVVGGT